MTMSRPISEADLDRLEELLDSDAFGVEGMLLDEIQAVLCAVAASPEAVPAETWISAVLGETPAWDSPEHEAEVHQLLLALAASITATLEAGEDVSPMLYPMEEDSEELDYTTWANAYLFGTELSAEDWFDTAGEHGDDLYELLYPALYLSGALEEDVRQRKERWLTPAEAAKATATAQEIMPELPQRVHAFWKIAGAPVKSLRREGAKVGRNDPCPCGSGKKFKQCCGVVD